MKTTSIPRLARRSLAIISLVFCSFQSVRAEALKVVIIAPEGGSSNITPITNYNYVQLKDHLQGLLDGSANHIGSEVTLFTKSRSLIYFHNSDSFLMTSFAELDTVIDDDFDVAILVNDPASLMLLPSIAFEGASRLSERFLKKGSDVYLLETEHQAVKTNAKETVYRIANGCGINVIPAAETIRQSPAAYKTNTSSQAYIMSGSIFSKITGAGISTNNTYSPTVINPTQQADLENIVLNTIASENTAIHYTTSFHDQGGVIHRPVDIRQGPFNGIVKFAQVGSSTENQIQLSIKAIIDDHYRVGGQTAINYDHIKLATNPKEITNVFNTAATLTNLANKDHYLFAYGRGQTNSLDPIIISNQANLLALPYIRHTDSLSYAPSLANWHLRNEDQMKSIRDLNGHVIPSFSILARNREYYVDPMFTYDRTHLTTEQINGISAAYLTSAVGIDFDKDELNRFKYYRENDPYFTGWNTIMQQANLSEDRTFTPDSDLDVMTDSLPNASTASPLNILLTASGGTAPFTWEETTGNLPMGVDLQPNGQLQGNALNSGGNYDLIFKVTDALGAIRKKALQLNTTGYDVDTALYGWDTGYYFDTAATPYLIPGSVITALNGGSSNVTVDGITFAAHNLGGGEKSAYSGVITSTGNAGYNGLLSTLSEGTANEAVIKLSGLTTGETYTLQVFYNNKTDASVNGLASQLHAEIDGIGEIILKASNSSSVNDDYGSYGVANFIASGAEVDLTLKARSDTHSIQGTVAFNGLLLTKPSTMESHDGLSRHAMIEWTAPVQATGPEDFILGTPMYALNGGHNNYNFGTPNITFAQTNIGKTGRVDTPATSALSNSDFALMMAIQTVTDYFHSFTFDNLTVGKQYQIQVFNKSTPLATYGSLASNPYRGSDTYFGLPNQGAAHIYADGQIMQSVGTFTATSTRQVLEMNANEENMIKDIAFSAIYLVEVTPYQKWINENGGQADTTFTGDPDNDGVENLLEYALNGDPSSSDPSILPILTKVPNGYLFSFNRNVGAMEDITMVFQYSSSLNDNQWVDMAMNVAEVTIGAESNGSEPVEIFLSDDMAVEGKFFGRLKVDLK